MFLNFSISFPSVRWKTRKIANITSCWSYTASSHHWRQGGVEPIVDTAAQSGQWVHGELKRITRCKLYDFDTECPSHNVEQNNDIMDDAPAGVADDCQHFLIHGHVCRRSLWKARLESRDYNKRLLLPDHFEPASSLTGAGRGRRKR